MLKEGHCGYPAPQLGTSSSQTRVPSGRERGGIEREKRERDGVEREERTYGRERKEGGGRVPADSGGRRREDRREKILKSSLIFRYHVYVSSMEEKRENGLTLESSWPLPLRGWPNPKRAARTN